MYPYSLVSKYNLCPLKHNGFWKKKWNCCGKSLQNGWGHCWKPFLSVLECVKEHFSILSKMFCEQSVASLRFRNSRTSKQIVTCKTQEIWDYYNLFAFSLGQCSQWLLQQIWWLHNATTFFILVLFKDASFCFIGVLYLQRDNQLCINLMSSWFTKEF